MYQIRYLRPGYPRKTVLNQVMLSLGFPYLLIPFYCCIVAKNQFAVVCDPCAVYGKDSGQMCRKREEKQPLCKPRVSGYDAVLFEADTES